jgi:mono/diheme cytochrome c family protein
LLETLQSGQLFVLKVLHAAGLAPDVHGQPAWPFAQRVAVETLVIDAGLTRQLCWALLCTALAVVFALSAIAAGVSARGRPRRRRTRVRAWLALLAAVVLCAVAPWPPLTVLLADATPTSFHRSASGFDAVSIERGHALYGRHCASCHGDDGRGEVARASTLPVWPPRLSGQLLWRRAEGEVFWSVAHGMHDRHGTPTMPGYAQTLSDADIWAVLDATRALAAGRSVREESAWLEPVRAPGVLVLCDGAPARPLVSYRGQRIRLVAPGDGAAPQEDPRVVTIALQLPQGPQGPGCTIADARAWRAYALVAGLAPDALAGVQFIVDRDGWLRALSPRGKSAWSRSDLMCRSSALDTSMPAGADGLGDLIAAIDADPIRSAAIGLPHLR